MNRGKQFSSGRRAGPQNPETEPQFKWRRPKRASEWSWQTEGKPFARKFVGYWVKWTLWLVPIPLAAVWLYYPETRVTVAVAGVTMFLLFPVLMWLVAVMEPWYRRRWPEEFALRDRGIQIGAGTYAWTRIDSAAISAHSELESIRMVTLTVRGIGRPVVLEFDAGEVDEEALANLISQRVHTDVLLRPADPQTGSDLLRPAVSQASPEKTQLLRPSE